MGWPITHESVIYCIRCKENGKVYIGRTYDLNRRIKEHFSELRRGMKRGYAAGRRAASGWQKDFNEFGYNYLDESIKNPFPAAKAGIPPRLPGVKEDTNA